MRNVMLALAAGVAAPAAVYYGGMGLAWAALNCPVSFDSFLLGAVGLTAFAGVLCRLAAPGRVNGEGKPRA